MFLIWGEGRGESSSGAQGLSWVVCPPLMWCCVQGFALLLLLTPCFSSRPFKNGSWGFWSLCIFCTEFTLTEACVQSLLNPYSFFFFFLNFVPQGEVCPPASCAALKQRSQVPTCLKSTFTSKTQLFYYTIKQHKL